MRQIASRPGWEVTVRTPKYAETQDSKAIPDAFLSHDSRDKEIAREIVRQLSAAGLRVWFDEYSLFPGDRLLDSIFQGLKNCNKCIMLISKNLISNPGWTRVEFESIFLREIRENQDIIIPIWNGVTSSEVSDYSPSLTGRVAVIWDKERTDATPHSEGQLAKLISVLYRARTESRQ